MFPAAASVTFGVGRFVLLFATHHFSESVPEFFGCAVINDRINAAVEVRQAVPQYGDSLVELGVWYLAKIRYEKMDVNRQPEDSEDHHHEDQETGGLLLTAAGLPLLFVKHRRLLLLEMSEDRYGQEADDSQGKHVREAEERGVQLLALDVRIDLAHRDPFVGDDAVGEENGHVESEEGDPDDDDNDDHVALGSELHGLLVVADGQVSDDGNEDQRVDRNVDSDVQQVVHQFTDEFPERKRLCRHLVRGKGRANYQERQIGDGQIKQEQVGDGSHLLAGNNNVNYEEIPANSDYGDQPE